MLVAKVFAGHQEDFNREVEVSRMLNHPNLVKFIEAFSIAEDGARHISIMPHFPLSVADILTQRHTQSLPLGAIRVVSRDCFAVLSAMGAIGVGAFGGSELGVANVLLICSCGGALRKILFDFMDVGLFQSCLQFRSPRGIKHD